MKKSAGYSQAACYQVGGLSCSSPAIWSVKTGKSLCRPNTLNEINDVVDNISAKVSLIWIPSHLGIAGNETVDQLAQSAVANDTIDFDIGFETNEIYTKMKEFIIAKWQTSWQTGNTGSFYRKIEPNVCLSIKYENRVRAKETVITRLRFGSHPTNEYLNKINVIESDKCDKCKDSVETVHHLLLGCPNSPLCDEVLNACERFNVSPQLELILKNSEIINVIFRNIKRTV